MTDKFLKLIDRVKNSEDGPRRILIIDGMNSYLRIWGSVPFMASNGEHAGGLVGFLRSIGSNIREFDAHQCIIVFDGQGGSTRRRKIYPEYKQHRSGKYNIRREEFATIDDERESQKRQLIRIIQYLDILPIHVLCLDNIEADDVISYIVQEYFSTDLRMRIVSTDRDFLQLVSDNIEVYSPVKKKLYTPEMLREEFRFHPNNYLLYRILTGDKSDNINGIHGAGLKTLLKYFPELVDNQLDHRSFVESVKLIDPPKSIHRNIISATDVIDRNFALMQLHDVDISSTAKMRIIDTLNQPINRADHAMFKKMVIEDYIGDAFRYPDEWLNTTFHRLNRTH